MNRLLPVVLAGLLAFSLACSPPEADISDALTPERTSLAWSGPVTGGDPREEDVFAFDVALGESYWDEQPGAIQVAIRWTEPGALEHEVSRSLYGMHVLDEQGRSLAATLDASGDIATAQSIDIGPVPDGRYTVHVTPERPSDGGRYEGIVFVQPRPSGELLPDLVARQPTNFSFFLGDGTDGAPPRSCLESELRARPGLERCLRFDAVISNDGMGPFIPEVDISEAVRTRSEWLLGRAEPPQGRVVQVVRHADSTDRRITTEGRWVIDREHAHAHIVDLAAFELYRIGPGGARTLMLTDEKVGFCGWDLVNERFGQESSGVREYPAYGCDVPEQQADPGPVIRELGISAGWADVYPARRPWQYLDASGLPDGIYDVVVRVDPNGWYEESDRDNNEAATRIRIAGEVISCVPDPYGCPEHFTRR